MIFYLHIVRLISFIFVEIKFLFSLVVSKVLLRKPLKRVVRLSTSSYCGLAICMLLECAYKEISFSLNFRFKVAYLSNSLSRPSVVLLTFHCYVVVQEESTVIRFLTNCFPIIFPFVQRLTCIHYN